MNRQAIFNAAVLGLRQQQAFSIVEREDQSKQCRYRGDNNTRCAVGFLIPDDNYDEDLEARSASSHGVTRAIGSEYGVPHEYDQSDYIFLSNLQYELHDSLSMDNAKFNSDVFEQAVRHFAASNQLEIPA